MPRETANPNRKYIRIALIVGVILIVVVWPISWSNGVYNEAITFQETVEEKWGDVQTDYQRRLDLIPNLVNTVKGAAENEKEILIQVTNARAGIVSAKTPEEMNMMGKKINTAINLAF